MEPTRGGPARQLALRTAAAAQLVLRQYRRASRASPVERHSVLSGFRRSCGIIRAEEVGGLNLWDSLACVRCIRAVG